MGKSLIQCSFQPESVLRRIIGRQQEQRIWANYVTMAHRFLLRTEVAAVPFVSKAAVSQL